MSAATDRFLRCYPQFANLGNLVKVVDQLDIVHHITKFLHSPVDSCSLVRISPIVALSTVIKDQVEQISSHIEPQPPILPIESPVLMSSISTPPSTEDDWDPHYESHESAEAECWLCFTPLDSIIGCPQCDDRN